MEWVSKVEALLAKATRFEGRPSLSPHPLPSFARPPVFDNDLEFQPKARHFLGLLDFECQSLRMTLQYGNLLDLSRSTIVRIRR